MASTLSSDHRRAALSERQFLRQIAAAELREPGLFFEPEVREVFRLDTRAPGEIRRAGGFFPNPLKPLMSIREHVTSEEGSGSFVSFSVNENVAQLISEGTLFFPDSNKLNYLTEAETTALRKAIRRANPGRGVSSALEFVREYGGVHYFRTLAQAVPYMRGTELPEPVRFETWAYRVNTLVAVTDPKGYLHKAENEAVGIKADLSEITAVRRVLVTRPFFVQGQGARRELCLTSKRSPLVEYDGPWRPLD